MELVRVAGQCWTIERWLEEANGEVGSVHIRSVHGRAGILMCHWLFGPCVSCHGMSPDH